MNPKFGRGGRRKRQRRAALLRRSKLCRTREACEGVLIVHGVLHGPWCPAR